MKGNPQKLSFPIADEVYYMQNSCQGFFAQNHQRTTLWDNGLQSYPQFLAHQGGSETLDWLIKDYLAETRFESLTSQSSGISIGVQGKIFLQHRRRKTFPSHCFAVLNPVQKKSLAPSQRQRPGGQGSKPHRNETSNFTRGRWLPAPSKSCSPKTENFLELPPNSTTMETARSKKYSRKQYSRKHSLLQER